MTQPPYIPRSGEQVYPPPYTAQGVQLYGFLAQADRNAIQANVCDRYLNAPLGGGDRFQAAGDHVLFVFNTIDQLRSTTPPFDQRGWFPEQEAAVWTIVADTVRERLFWYHPYMLVDNAYAMAMGREIYGFPKEIGWFRIPRGGDAPELLSVETLAVKTFGPDAAGERLPLFSVRAGSTGAEHRVLSGLEELVAELVSIARLEHGLLAQLGLGAHVLRDLHDKLMPMAFLKQFRDGAMPETACYQAIQEVDSRLVKLHGARFYGERYVVEINDLASHPVRADLGLAPGLIDVKAAFWLSFDFAIGACTEVWRSSGTGPMTPLPGAQPPAGGVHLSISFGSPAPATAPASLTGPGQGAGGVAAAVSTGLASPGAGASNGGAGGTSNSEPAALPQGAPGPAAATPRKRVAILGGGAAAMAAAWRLTSEPGWQERYEITLYQMGWRLGGKGASGRREPTGRIEEHGLHIWLGFYHNAYRALQEAYAEINPGLDESVPAGHSPPRIVNGVFARCEDAFEPQSYVGLDTDLSDRWDPWMMKMPVSDDKPWQGGSMPSMTEYARMLAQFLSGKAFADDSRPLYERDKTSAQPGPKSSLGELWKKLLIDADEALWSTGLALASALGAHLEALPTDPSAHEPADHSLMSELLRKLQRSIGHQFERLSAHDAHAAHHVLMLDTAAAVLRGLVADGAFHIEKFRLLDEEFRTWLARHGAMPRTCRLETNPLLRGLYDFVFAFDDGDATALDATGNFATAPALRTLLRMCFSYDGAIFWKMRAGMGDTIFTPFYKALRQRGVAFKFFHRVQQLHLDSGKTAIDSIDIAEQVELAPGRVEYDPLKRWVGLDCWPSTPDYAQLKEGQKLADAVAAQGVDLESMWFDWRDAGQKTLRRGVDFDEVVFAIPLGSVPYVADELLQASPKWRAMVDKVKTVRTMGLQLWLKPDLRGLGWLNEPPVIDSYMEPFDTWADMSHLLPREDWSAVADVPRNVAYLCGAMKGSAVDPQDRRAPLRARAEVWSAARRRVFATAGNLWPGAALPDNSLDETLIVDSYSRANIDPSELYVMSVAGSSGYRIKANETGFANLFIAGDWIDNGFNAGCVEAAVMSGLQAANAVLGRSDIDDRIYGRQLC